MRAVVDRRQAGRLSFGRAGAVISSFHRLDVALALVISAASAGVANAQSPASYSPALDVTAAIRAAVKLEPATRIEGAQISPLRPTQGPQLGDAIACLKLAGQPGGYIAVFFERDKVLSYRSAVVYDRCGEGPFTLLAAATPKAKALHVRRRSRPGSSSAPLRDEAKATAD
jgi:hypothetical protein